MKHAISIILVILLLGCSHSNNTPIPEKRQPRIEFIACSGSSSDFSLERKIYFNKEVNTVNDTSTISFDFMRDCCLEFEGKWQLEEKILTLSYEPKSENEEPPCDCKCTYTMKFHINNQDYSWYRIKIKNGQ